MHYAVILNVKISWLWIF